MDDAAKDNLVGAQPGGERLVLEVRWLGRIGYDEALKLQRVLLAEILAAREQPTLAVRRAGILLMLEHSAVITVSRRPTAAGNLVASAEKLAKLGVAVVETDRGGDITYHGPGQLVCYPILDLNMLTLRLHEYMRALEQAVISTCAVAGVVAKRDATATGVWVPADESGPARKICAMGIRVSRWISMHGLALNVTTDLAHFDLIVPCGLAGRPVTSLERELSRSARAPSLTDVWPVLAKALAQELGCTLKMDE